MADCYAPDMDELRWLPREIFADIGIADAAPPSAAAVEDVAVHLTGILVSKEGLARPPPPRPPAPYHRPHAPQVCLGTGRDGSGGVRRREQWWWRAGAVAGLALLTAAVAGPDQFRQRRRQRPFPGPKECSAAPSGPPLTKRRLGSTGGTGVFLPRAQAYQYQHKAAAKSPAKGRKPPKELLQGSTSQCSSNAETKRRQRRRRRRKSITGAAPGVDLLSETR
ncbi:hypothetical protein ZWY2020_028428 [Hordeum vulgare]|nr:hypothetical protein ZWY2020_028428 [Hordeum vulgare]